MSDWSDSRARRPATAVDPSLPPAGGRCSYLVQREAQEFADWLQQPGSCGVEQGARVFAHPSRAVSSCANKSAFPFLFVWTATTTSRAAQRFFIDVLNTAPGLTWFAWKGSQTSHTTPPTRCDCDRLSSLTPSCTSPSFSDCFLHLWDVATGKRRLFRP